MRATANPAADKKRPWEQTEVLLRLRHPRSQGRQRWEHASHATPSVIDETVSVLGRHHLTRRSATLVHSYLQKPA